VSITRTEFVSYHGFRRAADKPTISRIDLPLCTRQSTKAASGVFLVTIVRKSGARFEMFASSETHSDGRIGRCRQISLLPAMTSSGYGCLILGKVRSHKSGYSHRATSAPLPDDIDVRAVPVVEAGNASCGRRPTGHLVLFA
jgi:hypothetical protein